jgi:hypothetical protein
LLLDATVAVRQRYRLQVYCAGWVGDEGEVTGGGQCSCLPDVREGKAPMENKGKLITIHVNNIISLHVIFFAARTNNAVWVRVERVHPRFSRKNSNKSLAKLIATTAIELNASSLAILNGVHTCTQ